MSNSNFSHIEKFKKTKKNKVENNLNKEYGKRDNRKLNKVKRGRSRYFEESM